VHDPRLDRLAELIVGYSLALQPREIFRIEGGDVAESRCSRSTAPGSGPAR